MGAVQESRESFGVPFTKPSSWATNSELPQLANTATKKTVVKKKSVFSKDYSHSTKCLTLTPTKEYKDYHGIPSKMDKGIAIGEQKKLTEPAHLSDHGKSLTKSKTNKNIVLQRADKPHEFNLQPRFIATIPQRLSAKEASQTSNPASRPFSSATLVDNTITGYSNKEEGYLSSKFGRSGA